MLTRLLLTFNLTLHTSIFNMTAVVNTNPSILTVIQSGFIASAHYIVQPNSSSSLGKGKSICSCGKIEISNQEQCM